MAHEVALPRDVERGERRAREAPRYRERRSVGRCNRLEQLLGVGHLGGQTLRLVRGRGPTLAQRR
jgi:hypothetical protein